MNKRVRLVLLLVLALASAGVIAHSCFSVSYASDTGKMNEYRVTLLSLTHEVEHGDKGKLVDTTQSEEEEPAAEESTQETPAASVSGTSSRNTDRRAVQPKPAITPPEAPVSGVKSSNTDTEADTTLTQTAIRKPVPAKKPAPKKPAPRKKPGKKKGKACPT